MDINQGVSIALGGDGELAPPSERVAPILEGRAALFRAHFELDPGFSSREILARLILTNDDATETFDDQQLVDSDSDPLEVDSTFSFLIDGEHIRPDTTFSLELLETDGGGTDPSEPPRLPEEGAAELTVDPGPREFKVVFVPGHFNGTTLTITDESKQRLEDALMGASSVETVSITWRDPYEQSGQLESTEAGFDVMDEVRESDGLAPNHYVQMFLNRDGCCNDADDFQWSGIGGVPGDGMTGWAVSGRASMVMARDGDPGNSTGTAIHELGHNQGLSHAPCGGAAGPDENYPYQEPDFPQAGIGVQGYNLVSGRLYDPAPGSAQGGDYYADFMSYCWPYWWSDYNWAKNAVRAKTLSSWDRSTRELTAQRFVRAVVRPGDSTPHWTVLRVHAVPAEGSAQRLAGTTAYIDHGAAKTPAPVFAVDLSEGDRRMLFVPLDDAVDLETAALELAGSFRARTRLRDVRRIGGPVADRR
ncbi:MAG: hypothetical protein B7733_25615 [Myxococcales bacterium FL481]|nr:MAG: hypothetical protein B7733_25615 [Myxococcales bacterium FL481]